jgi:hypothetical protein
MWLLDANLDIHLLKLLQSLGTDCDTAENRGWKTLRNGDLVAACAQSGFDTLLTRDQLFAESASGAWRTFPGLAVVIVASPSDHLLAIWKRLPPPGPPRQFSRNQATSSSGPHLPSVRLVFHAI